MNFIRSIMTRKRRNSQELRDQRKDASLGAKERGAKSRDARNNSSDSYSREFNKKTTTKSMNYDQFDFFNEVGGNAKQATKQQVLYDPSETSDKGRLMKYASRKTQGNKPNSRT